MQRIPTAHDLTSSEMQVLRRIVSGSFTPLQHVNPQQRAHLLELGLIQSAMGGLMPTPAGKIVSRL
jgi:hypothetical protein